MVLKRQKNKGFFHRIGISDEKWIYHNNPKRKKVGKPRWTKSIRIEAKYLLGKGYALYMVMYKRRGVLWISETWWNY